MNTLNEKPLFPIGELFENDNFNKKVWLKRLITEDANYPIANVTFEPGCRNNWHKHQGGQILLVTDGKGWYQEAGKEAQTLSPGDVVYIPAHVKHWHGATKDSFFAHIALELYVEKGPAEWLEPVSDEEYEDLK